jgi:hypothetical protein
MATPGGLSWPTPRRKTINTYGKQSKTKASTVTAASVANQASTTKNSRGKHTIAADDIWSVPLEQDEVTVGTYLRAQGQVPPSPSSTSQNSNEETAPAPSSAFTTAKRRRVEDPYAFPIRERSGEKVKPISPSPAATLMPSLIERENNTLADTEPASTNSETSGRPSGKWLMGRRIVRSPKTSAVALASMVHDRSGRRQSLSPLAGPLSPKSPPTREPEKSSAPVLSGRVSKSRTASPKARKSRLIDRLAAQLQADSDDENQEEEEEEDETATTPNGVIDSRQLRATPEPVLPTTPLAASGTPKTRSTPLQVSIARKSGPKYSYGGHRSMLADALSNPTALSSTEEASETGDLPILDSFSQPLAAEPTSAFDEGLEDDEMENGAVKGIHELRQAGANSRFEDEMADTLDRIRAPGEGPSSLRRGALLELAQKMPDSNFRRQFRIHFQDGRLFRKLDLETDTVAAFAIAAILVHLLSSSKAPHLVEQLQKQGIQALLSHLLDLTSDITVIARDRKSNMSPNSRKALTTVKTSLLALQGWNSPSLSELSPRTLALKCANLLVAQTAVQARDQEPLTGSLLQELFAILTSIRSSGTVDEDDQQHVVDTVLTLHLIEHHSAVATQVEPDWTWTTQQLSVIASVVERSLRPSAMTREEPIQLVLKLVLDATNNNRGAELLTRRRIPMHLLQSVAATLTAVAAATPEEVSQFQGPDTLTLMLCILINFCEHYPPSIEQLQGLGQAAPTPLDDLFAFFYDHQARTGEVRLQIFFCSNRWQC